MILFRKRATSKPEPVQPQSASKSSFKFRAASTTVNNSAAQAAPAYRHIPSRAAADARNLRLPRLSVDVDSSSIDHQILVRSAITPTISAFTSPKHHALPTTTFTSPKFHTAPYATSNNKHPISAKGKGKSITNAPSPTTITNPSSSIITGPPKPHPQPPSVPKSPQSTEPYRHTPTHAATDAFLTSAGTHAAWHRGRIERLADHSRRLSIALSNPALVRPNMRRFGTSSTTISSSSSSVHLAALSHGRNSSGSGGTSSSAASVRSIDAVLCENCKGVGIPGDKRCRKHEGARGCGSGRSGGASASAASSVVLGAVAEDEVLVKGAVLG